MTHVRDAKFIVKEYLMTEIYKGLDPETRRFPTESLKRDDLKAGDKVIIPWITGGFFEATVGVDEGGGYFAETAQLLVILEFSDRWRTIGFVNKRGLKQVAITPPPDPLPEAASSAASESPAEQSSTPAASPTPPSDQGGQPPP